MYLQNHMYQSSLAMKTNKMSLGDLQLPNVLIKTLYRKPLSILSPFSVVGILDTDFESGLMKNTDF